jgi:hypothetical protein
VRGFLGFGSFGTFGSFGLPLLAKGLISALAFFSVINGLAYLLVFLRFFWFFLPWSSSAFTTGISSVFFGSILVSIFESLIRYVVIIFL